MRLRVREGSFHDRADTRRFLASLPDAMPDGFAPDREWILARAPGRLDLMGGIADYSGSLVLQLPIAAATHALLQRRTDRALRFVSLAADEGAAPRACELSLDTFLAGGQPISYEAARARFPREDASHWVSYAAGAFLVLMRERGARFDEGATILIQSDVPEGKGVSSSAALEVAVMTAVCAAYGIELPARELALHCQQVENLVAGAPCGVMDQMTSACGEADRLLRLLCQPAELGPSVPLPEELAVWGIDSGIRHSVGGSDYGTVRAAAFMGYRMIAELAGLGCRSAGTPGRVVIDDPRWRGYLANLSPEEFRASYAARLPASIDGASFLARYEGFTDTVTTIREDGVYPVFEATRHPIEEHARVRAFAEGLAGWRGLAGAEALGALMVQSHESYSACGLGSEGTDELVRLVREAGPAAGLYGAKITGGGSGGTVAVLGRRDARAAVDAVAAQYAARTGRAPLVLEGSSPGAGRFGHLILEREQ